MKLNVLSHGTAAAFALAIGILMIGPAVGATSLVAPMENERLFGFYDTFTDTQCTCKMVTVWSAKEVNRLGNANQIKSYREFWDCHVWSPPRIS